MHFHHLVNDVLNGNGIPIFRKLLQLRLLVIAGFIVFLWILNRYSEWPLHYLPITFVIAAVIAWSCMLLLKEKSVNSQKIARELVVDATWLAIVIFFSGRSANPFLYYFLVLIAISATLLPARFAWIFTGVCLAIYGLFLSFDLHGHFDHMSHDYQFHLMGMWINFLGSALVTCYFISKLAGALRKHQEQLSKIREDTLKNEQIVGIGTLAASTVHALGTPLSTLTVLLGEMKSNALNSETHEDIVLMLNQIERCKDTMRKLSSLAEQEEENLTHSESVVDLIDALRQHYLVSRPLRVPEIHSSPSVIDHYIVRSLLLRHALINLIDNAIKFSTANVHVSFQAENTHLLIQIEDDGPGIPQEVLKTWGKAQRSESDFGLGIGALLANSTIERLGGRVAIYRHDPDTSPLRAASTTPFQLDENNRQPFSKTTVTVSLPFYFNDDDH